MKKKGCLRNKKDTEKIIIQNDYTEYEQKKSETNSGTKQCLQTGRKIIKN